MWSQVIFLALWTPLMGWTVKSLFFDRASNTNHGEPIARIESQVGDIQFRHDEEILWRDVEENQYVFENDNISTGNNSYVSINFGNSRIIELGPHTQIRIRPPQKEGAEFELDLVRGNIAARDREGSGKDEKLFSAKPLAALKINSGGKTFRLRDDAEIALQKERASKETEVLMATGGIALGSGGKTGSGETIAAKNNEIALRAMAHDPDILVAVVTPQKKEEPKQEEPPKKVVQRPLPPPPPPLPTPPKTEPMPAFAFTDELKIKVYLPKAVFPPEGNVIWTEKTLSQVDDQLIPIVLEPPVDKPTSGTWVPLVGAYESKPKGGKFQLGGLWQGRPTFRRQVISMSLNQLKAKDLISPLPDNNGVKVTLTAGARITFEQDKEPMQGFHAPKTFKIRSFKPRSEGPVKINLGVMESKPLKNGWIIVPEDFKPRSWIYLSSNRELVNLAPILNASEGFSIENVSEPLEGKGVFIVRQHKVIGRLGGMIGSHATLDKIRTAVGADVIYEGTASAYIGGLAEFKDRALKRSLPEKVYILHSGRFIAVSRDFMKTNPTLRRFLEGNTSAFFSEPIETLSANNFSH